MIITRSRNDQSLEVAVYENDRLVIVVNRGGRCIARFTIDPDAMTDELTDIFLPLPKPGDRSCEP